jgi:sugar phosphate isomerase/epimerase
MSPSIPRREFLRGALAIGGALTMSAASHARLLAKGRNEICAFIKFVQSLSYDQLADAIADIGFDGIEATVRSGGYIAPPRAGEELPKLVEALAKRNLKITMITTDVLRADQPNTEPLLRTAAKLGIPMYRMGFYKYDLKRPVMDQLRAIEPALKELAALNREIGIQAVYQNHSGAEHLGSMVWDFYSVVKEIPVDQIALAFDIRHATIEAGLSWPAVYNAMRPRIAAVYVKDFDWVGRQAEHVPLGKGRVDAEFFTRLAADNFQGPISLHVEYLEDGNTEENLEALRRDFGVLHGWLPS